MGSGRQNVHTHTEQVRKGAMTGGELLLQFREATVIHVSRFLLNSFLSRMKAMQSCIEFNADTKIG